MGDDLTNRICSRCLVILDVRTSVTDATSGESCTGFTNPRSLRAWVEDRMWGQGHRININDQSDAFDPVGTWHGDAVCWAHLIDCRQRELRNDR